MRITTNFLLKKAKQRSDGTYPVYIRATLDGKRIELSTGVFVSFDGWDKTGQKISNRYPNSKLLNNRLTKVLNKLTETYYQLDALGEEFDIRSIKERLCGTPKNYLVKVFQLVIDSIEKKIGYGYSYGTYKHYKTTLKRLKLYLNEVNIRQDIALNKIDYNFINSFDTWLKVKHKVSGHTAGKYHKQLKKVLNDAIAMNLLDKNPYINFKIKGFQGKRDYLTLEEVTRIERKKFAFTRINIVRDVFVFACYTGLSYSEIANLKPNSLSKGDDGEEWIVTDRLKTNTRCRIPLLSKAKSIIEKYKDYPINVEKGRLLPINSNQKMNAYLKEIADICQIDKKLSMHVARHTFATSITLANGVPIETVSKMLGHNSLKTTQIYGKIIDSKITKDMKKLKTLL
ncbi:site-specific integrase [Carboxylicivirga sediminis]|uniref:Site-specific integrase n=1 Tax=Carboxylicivirga sediminis TaxID=2006564 RepID=A0A941F2U7_9BACT|nr:site-specific integrase [Carboxylicivirga sediminis]MBR8535776.1 site-specific integrase [Carboxylicivirga sediminis]